MYKEKIEEFDARTQGERNTKLMLVLLNEINNKLNKLMPNEPVKNIVEVENKPVKRTRKKSTDK